MLHYVYVCVYISIYIYTYLLYIYIAMYIYIYIYTHVCIYIHTHVCIYIYSIYYVVHLIICARKSLPTPVPFLTTSKSQFNNSNCRGSQHSHLFGRSLLLISSAFQHLGTLCRGGIGAVGTSIPRQFTQETGRILRIHGSTTRSDRLLRPPRVLKSASISMFRCR